MIPKTQKKIASRNHAKLKNIQFYPFHKPPNAAALLREEHEKVLEMEAHCLCASGRGALESKRLPP